MSFSKSWVASAALRARSKLSTMGSKPVRMSSPTIERIRSFSSSLRRLKLAKSARGAQMRLVFLVQLRLKIGKAGLGRIAVRSSRGRVVGRVVVRIGRGVVKNIRRVNAVGYFRVLRHEGVDSPEKSVGFVPAAGAEDKRALPGTPASVYPDSERRVRRSPTVSAMKATAALVRA
jgi:hypothetical protein